MSNEESENVYPIANWDLGPIPQHNLVVFRPHFISTPEQGLDDAEISRYYALTVEQAKELQVSLQNAIDELEAATQ